VGTRPSASASRSQGSPPSDNNLDDMITPLLTHNIIKAPLLTPYVPLSLLTPTPNNPITSMAKLIISLFLLLLVVPSCLSQNFNLGDLSGMGGNCAFDKCTKEGKVGVQSLDRPTSNGCSVPDFVKLEEDFDFNICCDQHDACYQACGVSKSICETAFNKCLVGLCKANYKDNEVCENTAQMFVLGTKLGGCPGYLESQELGCDCVSTDEAEQAKFVSLFLFYNTHNNTKTADDVKSALAKYDGKEGTMWAQLFNKFPDHVEVLSRDGKASKSKKETRLEAEKRYEDGKEL
jgi:hypothetical protein